MLLRLGRHWRLRPLDDSPALWAATRGAWLLERDDGYAIVIGRRQPLWWLRNVGH